MFNFQIPFLKLRKHLKREFSIRILMAGSILILFQSCAPVSVKRPSIPFNHPEIGHIISSLEEQERRVHTVFSSGSLMFKREDSEAESNILIVGARDPFRIKIEVTHSWGTPLLHILIHETGVHILAFREKRYYVGARGNFGPSRSFPVDLHPDQVWALARGYPLLLRHNRAVSAKGDQIMFLNRKGETVQVIDFFPGSVLPHMVSFPGRRAEMSFSDYENQDGTYHASDMILNDRRAGNILALDLKQVVFNKSIPEAVFNLEIPHGFETVVLQGGEEK